MEFGLWGGQGNGDHTYTIRARKIHGRPPEGKVPKNAKKSSSGNCQKLVPTEWL